MLRILIPAVYLLSFPLAQSCETGQVIYLGTCQNSCPDGYTTTTDNICKQCSSNCVTCRGSVTFCESCSLELYLYEGYCQKSCPAGTYPSGSHCILCNAPCVTCSGPFSCLKCQGDKVKFETLCLDQCPSGYQSNNGVCEVIPATPNCASGCTTDMLYNGECDDACNFVSCNADNLDCSYTGTCAAGKFFNGSKCVDCTAPCTQCVSPSSCLACGYDSSGKALLLYNYTCYSTCPDGTLQQGVICVNCSTSCKTCALDINTCTSCPTGRVLHNGACLSSCPLDTTVNLNGICVACDINCSKCIGLPDFCSACASGRVLYNGICYSSCPSGTTTTSSFPSTCRQCDSSCLTCSVETYFCTSCASGRYLYNKSCMTACPAKITVTKGTGCVACNAPCIECSEDENLCTLCESGKYLLNNVCVSQCPIGYYSSAGKCMGYCSDNCTPELLSNSSCDAVCNTVNCNFDNGMCLDSSGCGNGQYRSGVSCVNCVSPCNTCISASYCTACQKDSNGAQLLLYDGTCYTSCPDGSYREGIICKKCSSKCTSCEGSADYCYSCATNYKLWGNSCVDTCPIGVSISTSTQCNPCSSSCSLCETTTTRCIKCTSPLLLHLNTCILTCPSGYTETSSNPGVCSACTNNCATCTSFTNFCLSCNTGFFLLNNQCLSSCPPGYTNLSTQPGVCAKCSSNCYECNGLIDRCSSCNTDYYLTSSFTCQLTKKCPSGSTVTATSNGSCVECIAPCAGCLDKVDSCTSCIAGLGMVNGVCTPCNSPCSTCLGSVSICMSCIEGYYLAGTRCLKCDSNCKSCSGSAASCTECISGMFLKDKSCFLCNSECLTCEGTANKCTSCSSNKFLENSGCVSCDPNCKTCTSSSTRCTSCASGYYLDSNNRCIQCSSTCKECRDSSTTCTECVTGKTLIANTCGVCKSTCKTCTINFDTCASCYDGLFLLDGVCGICKSECLTCIGNFDTCGTCRPGFSLKDGGCMKCNDECSSCDTTPGNCISCFAPYTLFTNICGLCDATCKTCAATPSTCTSCPSTLALIGTQCIPCDSNCKTCAGSITSCTSCAAGYYLDNAACKPCDSNCMTCEGSASNCTGCINGKTLIGNLCKAVCPEGYYLDVEKDLCTVCSANCKSCKGSADSCTGCRSGVLFQDKCVLNCPDGYYKTSSGCLSCGSLCKTCSSSYGCTSCIDGYKLVGINCEKICQEGYYLSSNTCIRCSSNCQACIRNSDNCTACYSGMVLNIRNRCEIPCEVGYTRTDDSGEECLKCLSVCKRCRGKIDYCVECEEEGKYLYKGNCLDKCPSGVSVKVGNYCQDCDANCATCVGSPQTCTSCGSELYLFNSQCLKVCPQGYEPVDSRCKLCADPNNCPYTPPDPNDTDTDSDSDPPTNSTDPVYIIEEDDEKDPILETGGGVPFPFSIVSIISLGLISATKLAVSSVSIIPSGISIFSITSTTAWLSLVTYIPSKDSDSRRLLEVDDEFLPSIATILLIVALILQALLNILFIIFFRYKIWGRDQGYLSYKESHTFSAYFIYIMSGLMNYNLTNLLWSNMCNLSVFRAKLDLRYSLMRYLIRVSYVYIPTVILLVIVSIILIIAHYPTTDIALELGIDVLAITIIYAVLIAVYIKQMEKALIKVEMSVDLDIERLEDKNDNTIEHSFIMSNGKTPGYVMYIPSIKGYNKPKERKGTSKSVGGESNRMYYRKRKNSFPLDNRVNVKVDITSWMSSSDNEILPKEEIYETKGYLHEKDTQDTPEDLSPDTYKLPKAGMSILNEDFIYNEEDNLLISEQNLEGKDIDIEQTTREVVQKVPKSRTSYLAYRPLNMNLGVEITTELVAYTEDAEDSEEEPVEEILAKSRLELHLGTIENELELDWEKALVSSSNFEIITIPYKDTKQRLILKKSFNGCLILTEGNELGQEKRLNYDECNLSMTIVNELDPHYAVFTTLDGTQLRVFRLFEGAKIIDIEDSSHPCAYLIGSTVVSEEDFNFSHAVPDLTNPEIVIAFHYESGYDVRIRKPLHESVIVDNQGNEIDLVNVFSIDRDSIQIDPADIHYLSAFNLHTHQIIQIRRNFIGGKIIAFDRNVRSRGAKTYGTERTEPEPNSPHSSMILHKPHTAGSNHRTRYRDPNLNFRRLNSLADVISGLELKPGSQITIEGSDSELEASVHRVMPIYSPDGDSQSPKTLSINLSALASPKLIHRRRSADNNEDMSRLFHKTGKYK